MCSVRYKNTRKHKQVTVGFSCSKTCMELLCFSDILVHLSLLKSFFFATLYATCWNVHEYSLQKTKQNRPFIMPLFAHLHVKVAGTKFKEKMASHNLIPKRIPLLTADSITQIVICHTSQQPSHPCQTRDFLRLSHVIKYATIFRTSNANKCSIVSSIYHTVLFTG
jgi:hypothetical protein